MVTAGLVIHVNETRVQVLHEDGRDATSESKSAKKKIGKKAKVENVDMLKLFNGMAKLMLEKVFQTFHEYALYSSCLINAPFGFRVKKSTCCLASASRIFSYYRMPVE